MNARETSIAATLAAGALIVAMTVGAAWLAGRNHGEGEAPAGSPSISAPPGAVPTDSPVDAAATNDAIAVASRVVAAMYSFDYKSAGPNAWLEAIEQDPDPRVRSRSIAKASAPGPAPPPRRPGERWWPTRATST